jgi:hypothetical protein
MRFVFFEAVVAELDAAAGVESCVAFGKGPVFKG